MKLKKSFITQDIQGTQIMIEVGDKSFHGIVRSNSTAAFIIDHLKNDTSEEELVAALLTEYEVEPERARNDVHLVIEKLMSIGAIE